MRAPLSCRDLCSRRLRLCLCWSLWESGKYLLRVSCAQQVHVDSNIVSRRRLRPKESPVRNYNTRTVLNYFHKGAHKELSLRTSFSSSDESRRQQHDNFLWALVAAFNWHNRVTISSSDFAALT